MDFVLVFQLMLFFLSTRQSSAEETQQNNSCYKKCPPGYYKAGICDDPDADHRCEICGDNTFTEKENSLTEGCLRCNTCDGDYEVKIRPCSFNRDVQCDCKEGYFSTAKTSVVHKDKLCKKCKCDDRYCAGDNYPDYKRKCKSCERCSGFPECTRNCGATTNQTSTNPEAVTSSTIPSTISTVLTETSYPFINLLSPNSIPWLFLFLILGTIPVFVWILWLFTRSSFTIPDCCLCWSKKKDRELHVENPKFSEQSSHQCIRLNTQTINISEETPMVTVSQSPAHSSPPDADHKAIRKDEQSDHWPAIVLYAIIKEVPLRRWKEFLRLLMVTDQQLERVELDTGLGQSSMERQYQMLRLWSQRSAASLNDVFAALHYMDLYGCAQLLQESLDKLQLKP